MPAFTNPICGILPNVISGKRGAVPGVIQSKLEYKQSHTNVAMLIEYIRQGEQIASGCRGSKSVKGVKARYVAWSRSVEECLKDDPMALARFRNAQPVLDVPPDIAAGVANHWKKLQGQLAVLNKLAREREQEEVFALSPILWGRGGHTSKRAFQLRTVFGGRLAQDGGCERPHSPSGPSAEDTAC